jgi:hypothetical protein
MKNKIIASITLILMLFSMSFIIAHGEDIFAEAEEIIMNKTSCNDISEDQLEILGDYYMEQMHPGELHEIMDERMGGEGSESLRIAHINMGNAFYCGEHDSFSRGMMDIMMGRGMMGINRNDNYSYDIFNSLFIILLTLTLILLIIWLIIKIRIKK